MKLLSLTVAVLLSTTILAQAPLGSITGKVMDKTAGESMPFATVSIKGTTKGATTDFDGNFSIEGLEAGTYTLVASFVGYAPVEATYIVGMGEETHATIDLEANQMKLEEVVITAKAQTESELSLIQVQRKSVEMKQSIGAQELSRKGVGNAQSAVAKVSGVSLQSNVVYVRGLGDRYNSTSLNGLPLPSQDPELKNIDLKFFDTDVINSINVNKTFGTELYGDVSGANINLVSKKLFDDKELAFKGSTGVNTTTNGQDFARIAGTNYLGAENAQPLNSLTNYRPSTGFNHSTSNSPINTGFAVRAGKRFYFKDKTLDALFVASNSTDYAILSGSDNSSLAANGGFGRLLNGSDHVYRSTQSMMGNLNLEIDETTTLSYSSFLMHTNKQRFLERDGQAQNLSEVDGMSAFYRRQQINDNLLFVNQLHAEKALNERTKLNAAIGLNLVVGNEPDRKTNTFIRDDNDNTYQVASGSAGLNHRFFSELNETEVVGKVVGEYALTNDNDSNNKLSVGYNVRSTNRDFGFSQFSFATIGAKQAVDINDIDATFTRQSVSSGIFEIVTNRGRNGNPDVLVDDTYNGERVIHAGFTNITYDVGDKLTLNGGVRFEYVDQSVTWDFNQDRNRFPGDNLSNITNTYLLPSLNARYALNDDNIIRFATSKTYTMPQFKEVAPFLYEDISASTFGNEDLTPSDVYNVDVKLDHYFSRAEFVSIGGFYKKINNSINRILVESAATEMSYVNSGDATVSGVEIELRKSIWSITPEAYLDAGLNVSYLYTNQELVDNPNDKLQPRFTKASSALQGASPLLLNADLTFKKEGSGLNLTSALVYESFYDRIFSVGTSGVNDILEVSVGRLDWISKLRLNDRVDLGLSIKNMMNPNIRFESKNATSDEMLETRNYKRGTQFSIGFTYRVH